MSIRAVIASAGVALVTLTSTLPSAGRVATSDEVVARLAAELEGLRDRYDNGPWPGLEREVRGLLDRTEVELGSEHPFVADVLDLYVQVLFNSGQRRRVDSLSYATRAVDLRRRHQGEHSAQFAASLLNLAALLADNNQRALAITMYERSLKITTSALGEGSDQEARTREFLGDLYLELDDFTRAEKLLGRALAIRLERHGELDPSVAQALNTLSKLDMKRGEWDAAVVKLVRAMRIYRATLSPENPMLLRGVSNLANAYSARGDLELARDLFVEALEGRRRTVGDYHPVTASTHGALGQLLQRAGELESARYHFQESSLGYRRGLGSDHPSYALAASRLADVKLEVADYEGAEVRAVEALSIRRKAYGDEHAAVASSLSQLGEISLLQGRLEEARRHLEQALLIQRKVLGAAHPAVAETLLRLANLAEAEGDLPTANADARAALGILDAAEDAGFSRVRMLTYVAKVGFLSGRDADASSAVEKAFELLGSKHIPDHPLALRLGLLRALLHYRSGDHQAARRSGLAMFGAALGDTQQTLGSLTEREAFLYSGSLFESLSLLLSLTDDGGRPDQAAVESAFAALVRSRSVVVETLAERHRFLRAASDPRTQDLYARWITARDRLGQLLLREAGIAPQEDGYNLLDDARLAVDRAEEDLVISLAGRSTRRRDGDDADVARIVGALAGDEALVSLALYDDYGGTLRREPAPRRYMAFVATSEPRALSAVDLGPAPELDALVDGLLAATRQDERSFRRWGTQLRERLWDPLAPSVGARRRVFLVLDGKLNLVNFYALPTGADRYLIDSGVVFHALETERDLVAPPPPVQSKGLLAVGSPDFDSSSGREPVRVAALDVDSSRGVSLAGGAGECHRPVRSRFAALPATRREVEEVLDLWSANVPGEPETALVATAATEPAFRSVANGKRILHLATHGFVHEGSCDAPRRSGRARSLFSGTEADARSGSFSGLALAGANHLPGFASGESDGILTTQEIAALDLDETQWAVLSACATGVGEIWAGEGVDGLQRAFRIAGARSVIMSLWPAEDEPTARWMSALYRARLAKHLDTAESVRFAAAEALASMRDASASTHPRSWAAFVSFGDWR
jgi:CHAT domain-containing protein/tetratricopeptide (TPR) repeat protein